VAFDWFRVDVNIKDHDKILNLLEQDNGRAIAFSYVCALAYSTGAGTDGFVPFRAVPIIHATEEEMGVMRDAGLVKPHPKGWEIVNFARRQATAEAKEITKELQRKGAQATNCKRKGHKPPHPCAVCRNGTA